MAADNLEKNVSMVTAEHIQRYEGFIYTHSLRLVGIIDLDVEDIRQEYRLKTFKALGKFDAPKMRRAGESVEDAERRFVFMCLKNFEKDLLKRRRSIHVLLDDLTEADGDFEIAVEDPRLEDLDVPLIPNTLTDGEREIVLWLYRGFQQVEIASELGLKKRQVQIAVANIREKMADWRPGSALTRQVREHALEELGAAA